MLFLNNILEKFGQVTILFSDIVTFTNIAAAVQPMEIVQLLNSLYGRFDLLTEIHGVYKVSLIIITLRITDIVHTYFSHPLKGTKTIVIFLA